MRHNSERIDESGITYVEVAERETQDCIKEGGGSIREGNGKERGARKTGLVARSHTQEGLLGDTKSETRLTPYHGLDQNSKYRR
jgi:hypothetical protein